MMYGWLIKRSVSSRYFHFLKIRLAWHPVWIKTFFVVLSRATAVALLLPWYKKIAGKLEAPNESTYERKKWQQAGKPGQQERW
jgi:hypothetical protein